MTLPKRVVFNEPPLHAFKYEIAQTESIFGRWARYCLHHTLTTSEATKLMAPFSARSKLLSPRVDGVQETIASGQRQIAQLLGLNSVELACATGAVLGDQEVCVRSFHPCLRVCAACIRQGFHSVVYQHRAVVRCPLHDVALTTACPSCGMEDCPSYASVAQIPFGCPRCKHERLPPNVVPGHFPHFQLIGLMLADRARELGITDEPRRSFVARSAGPSFEPGELASCVARSASRQLVWTVGENLRWPRFDTSCAFLDDWQSQRLPRLLSDSEFAAVKDTLNWLEHVCARPDECSRVRYPLLDASGRVQTSLDGPISVSTAALHLTMARYTQGRMHALTTQSSRIYADVGWSRFQSGRALSRSPTGNALLLRAEILAYFCVALLQVLRLSRMDGVDWEMNADPRGLSAPAWVVEARGGGYRLFYRPRASIGLVTKLLRRYCDRTVLARCDRIDLGARRRMDAAPELAAFKRSLGFVLSQLATGEAPRLEHFPSGR